MKHRLGIVLCILSACMLFSCATTDEMNDYYEKEWSCPTAGIDSINIDLSKSSLEVRLCQGNQFYVTLRSPDESYPECYVNGSTLVCKDKFFGVSSRNTVEILVPESFFAESWYIKDVSGKMKLSQLWASSVQIEATSGSVSLSKCEVQNLSLSAVSGSVTAENLYCPGKAEINSVSGSVKVSGVVGGGTLSTVSGSLYVDMIRIFNYDTELSTLSGSIKLLLPENNGYSISYDTLSGRVTDEFTEVKVGKNGKADYKRGGVHISMESLSGSLSVQRKN